LQHGHVNNTAKNLKASQPPGISAGAHRAPAVMVRGLRKSFGDQLVLDGIDLDVAEGTVHALLGRSPRSSAPCAGC